MTDHETIAQEDVWAKVQHYYQDTSLRLGADEASAYTAQDAPRRDIVLKARLGRRRALDVVARQRMRHGITPRPVYTFGNTSL